jgi:peroxiredoxin
MNSKPQGSRDRLEVGDLAPPFEQRPVFGLPVTVPTSGHPLVLLFVRHLGDPFARQALAEVQKRYADFDRLGIKMAAITQTELTTARDFVPRYHVLCPVVTDPEGQLHKSYGIGCDRFLVGSLKGLVQGSPGRLAAALNLGHGKLAGPARQLTAEFVIDRAGRIAAARYAESITDGPHLNDLLKVASSC